MHKLYLLLRSNKQSGPHSLEELVQFNLKPTDLVWVEGKSSIWSYPTEIEILKPYVSEGKEFFSLKPESTSGQSSTHDAYMPPGAKNDVGAKEGSTGKVYVSLPRQMTPQPEPVPEKASTYDLEQKADELRARIQAAAAQNRQVRENIDEAASVQNRQVGDNKPRENAPESPVAKNQAPKKDVTRDAPLQVKASRSLNEIEEEYTSWVYQKKAKKTEIPAKLVARGIAVAIILVGSYLGARYFINTENDPAVQTNIPAQASNEAAQPMLTQTEIDPEEIGAEDFNTVKEDVTDNNVQEPPAHSTSIATVPATSNKTGISNNTGTTNNNGNASRKQARKIDVPAKSTDGSNEGKTAEPETPPVRSSEASTQKEDEPVVAATPQKKKKFGEKIDDFFNKLKRKKGEEQAETSTQPADEPETRPSSGGLPERKVRRRGEEAPPVSKIENIEEHIDITASEPAEKFMLGIQGLKLTLHNRSSETVKTATVEVRYYSEQNELLESKTVTFNKIAPKRSMTLGAPDHRLANHTDYRLVSASN